MSERTATPPWPERVTLPLTLGAAFSAALMGASAPNTACEVCGSALFGALLAGVGFIMIRRYLRPIARRIAQILLPMLVAVGLFALLSRSSNDVFESAFGVRPPVGVHELRADNRYAGGPGDTTAVLSFGADRSTIDVLVQQRPFVTDDQGLDEWRRSGNWQQLCYDVFGNQNELGAEPHGGRPSIVPPMRDPHVYKWQQDRELPQTTTLLWDAATGRAYVQWLAG